MLYRLSYLWYTLIGFFVSMTVSLAASFLTRPQDPRDLDQALLAPIVRRFIPERKYPNQPRPDEIIYAYGPNSIEGNAKATEEDIDMDKMKGTQSA